MVTFSQSTTTLPSVGPKLASLLHKCRINTIQDLLFHLPYRYQDRTRITPIADLREQDWAVVQGTIIQQEVKRGRKNQLICYLQDSSHCMVLRFFYFNQSLKRAYEVGTTLRAFGQLRLMGSHLEMVHPECHVLQADTLPSMEETLTPIYSVTHGLTQTRLRQLTNHALTLMENEPMELLPTQLLESYQFPELKDCLHFLHHPPPDANIDLIQACQHPAQMRLAFEELLSHHLSVKQLRLEINTKHAHALAPAASLKKKFISQLPFKLTNAQKRVSLEIEDSLKKTTPMYRLIQGDVGSGKTLVAALSTLPAILAKSQVALMAPTELLARQHFETFSTLFKPLEINVLLLTGKQTAKLKKENQVKIKTGEAQIIIGTHALFQKNIDFHDLSLVIIDEQHRFGVEQRLSLTSKGQKGNSFPHQLIMTATPIPRTLAMTQYANLDISVIDELPPGRTPIKTAVFDSQKRDDLILRLKVAFKEGKQAYWVCTLIEESETLQCQNAEETAARLKKDLKPYQVGLIHGRMKPDEKNTIMNDFLQKKTDILVATTVIEVGVDVPNASLMIIENAERFGLSQLHQLRGRVGRGSVQSHCVLLYQTPLSHDAKKRLHVIRDSTDGFVISEEDLKIRGSGEVLGTKQTGLTQLKVANLEKHQTLLDKIAKASALLENNPECVKKLIRRWLGDGEKYLNS
jgi:ATP-dependent DNA helicase RecG